ncbi:zinc finger, CCHC-type containing protein [Tanacetum coccineum]
MAAVMKHMVANFSKLDKFEWVDFKRWQKNMHFILSTMSVVYVLTTQMVEYRENATVEQIWKMIKWDNDDYVCRGIILNGISRAHDSDKPKSNNVDGSSVVNMVEPKNSTRYTDNRGKCKHLGTKADLNKKSKVTCWKCKKPGHLKKDCKGGKVGNKANVSGTNGSVNGSNNLLKDEALDKFKLFKTKVELQQGSLIKRFRTDMGGTRDEVFDQHFYCFDVDDEPKTFDEAMKSRDGAF